MAQGIDCFAAIDENPSETKDKLMFNTSLTLSDKNTIDESFEDPVETNPFKIMNQTNPFFKEAFEEYQADHEISGNLNFHDDKFHRNSESIYFKKQIGSTSSSSSSEILNMDQDSLDTID